MLKPLDQADFSTLLSEVCIVGAGPAGITLALELADKGVDVVLLEGGGMAPPEPEGLDLYRGEVNGRQYPLRASRLRYFGGTSEAIFDSSTLDFGEQPLRLVDVHSGQAILLGNLRP